MIKVAICDDEIKECEHVKGLLMKYVQKHLKYEATVVCFLAPLELLSYVDKHGGFDIYLLDVYMQGIIGTDVAKELRQLGDKGEIIFLTSSRNHAIDAFEVDATQYLIKPYSENSFFSALDKILSRQTEERRQIITLKTSDGIVRLFTRNIIFTETGRNNYQIIHTIQGDNLEVRMTSSELFAILSQRSNFVKCGASININLKFVRQIKKDFIVFDSGEQIAYPYRSYQAIKEKFLRFQMSSD